MKLDLLMGRAAKFNERVRSQRDSKYVCSWVNYIYHAVRYGASPDDYFRYRFYAKTHSEKNQFITYRKSKRLIEGLNTPKEVQVQDKAIFNKFFAEFVRREWLDIRNCSYEDFVNFIGRHPSVIVKPPTGASGKGIWKYQHDEGMDLADCYERLRGQVIEEVIRQHRKMGELNPSSVNTIRVLTVKNGASVKIVACSLRIGQGSSVVDNLRAGGMSASVDPQRGVVFTSATNVELEKFEYHPITRAKFEGFEIPHWDQVINAVLTASRKIPGLRYLGWDVAVTPRGVELIEVNPEPGHALIQVSDQVGKYEIIKDFIS